MPVTEAEVFKAMYATGDQEKIRKVGFSLLDIKNYLASRGFQADGYKLTFEQLVKVNRPAIAVVTAGAYRHFVVVKGARNGKVLIGDPAGGLRTYSNAEFSQIWNGVIFAIHASADIKAPYNRDEEWSPWAVAPLGQPMGDSSLSSFTRELPPIYQITSMINGNPSITP
jgi:predicted double-glycine peptidase